MPDINIIGHRGASRDAPENTLAAFRLAWEQGADGIEGDFRLTADGEIVAMHDPTCGRTAGVDLVVARATLARLRQLDAGAWKGEAWRGERIPTLREVIATVPAGKMLFIELKSGPEILLPLAALLAETGFAPDRAVILSFSDEQVAACRDLLPRHKVLWITDFRRNWRSGGWTPDGAEILATLERIGAHGLASRAHRCLDDTFVKELRSAEMELHVWTVDAPRAATRFVTFGVDSITTNRPGWLKCRLQKHAEP